MKLWNTIVKSKSQNSNEMQLQKGVGPIVPQLRSINCSSRLRLWGRPNLGATLWPEILTFSNFEAFLSEFYAQNFCPEILPFLTRELPFFWNIGSKFTWIDNGKKPHVFGKTVLNYGHSSVVAKHSEQEQTILFKNVVINLMSTPFLNKIGISIMCWKLSFQRVFSILCLLVPSYSNLFSLVQTCSILFW